MAQAARLLAVDAQQPVVVAFVGLAIRCSRTRPRRTVLRWEEGSGPRAGSGACPRRPPRRGLRRAAAPGAAPARTYYTADRATLTGYSYDTLGRTTTLPAADSPPGLRPA